MSGPRGTRGHSRRALLVTAALWLLVAPATIVRAQGVEVPAAIAIRVQQIHGLRLEGKTPEARELSDVVGEAIYRWVADALRHNSAESVVAALTKALPVIAHEADMSFEERQNVIYHRTEDIVVSVTVWQQEPREVVVMRVDQRSADPRRKEPEQYLLSRPPVLFAKQGEQVIVGDLETADGPNGRYRFRDNFWSVFTFMAFVEPPKKGGWPDVLLSRGPAGQGLYMTPLQMHLEEAPKGEWQVIWDDEGYAGGSLEFDKKKQVLTACWSDRRSDAGGCEKFHVRHGSALAPYRPIHRVLAGVPDPEPMSQGLAALLETPAVPDDSARLSDSLVGTWTLESYLEEPTQPSQGGAPQVAASDPSWVRTLHGVLIYKESRAMSVEYAWQGKNTEQGEPPEKTYTSGASGWYSVDPSARTITYNLKEGVDVPRHFEITGDRLILRWTKPEILRNWQGTKPEPHGETRVTETWSRKQAHE